MIEPEKFLSQRDRIIQWVPIIAFILIIAMEFTPYYQNEFSNTNLELSDEEQTITVDYYDDYALIHSSSEDRLGSNESSDWFGGNMQEIKEINDPDDEEYLSSMMEEVDSKLSTWTTIFLIIFLLLIASRKEKINFNKYVKHETILGALLAFISISSVFLIFSTIGFGTDFSDEYYGDVDDGDADEFAYNDGFWGSVYFEFENGDGGTFTSETTWGPHIGFLLLIFLSLFTMLGAAAFFLTQFEKYDVEQSSTWFSIDDLPDSYSKYLDKLPTMMVAATIILAIGSVFTPWYEVEQTWEGVHDGNDNRTTHEFGWTLSPFIVIFDNQSGLGDKVAGEKSTEYNSYSDHPELENIAEPLLELRWPLICIVLLSAIAITRQFSSKIADAIQGEEKSWNTLFLAAIVISISMTNSAFEDGIFRKAEDDLDDLSASYYIKPDFDGARDSNFGQEYTTVINGSWWEGDDVSIYNVQVTWGNSIGAKMAYFSELIGMFAIALIWTPIIIRHSNRAEIPKFSKEDLEQWKGRPAIGMMVAVILITSLGGGVGELVASSKSSAPEGLSKWYITYENTGGNVQSSATMSDGESIDIIIDTSEFALGNTTFFGIDIICREGDDQSQFNSLDSVNWSLDAPDDVNVSGYTTEGSVTCSNENPGQDYAYWYGEWEYPDEDIYAQNAEEALDLFRWIRLGDGVWTLTLTASIGEDFSPIQDDDSCDVIWDIQLGGIDNVIAVIDEE
ncbi:MAG: hypothetical protein CMB57_05020 [Euryarchaeota archaeon]|mgnify:CR=1 FL=1|nr:hypothetical protein [Euryarchaeota archaeon]|tara:strand:+ start:10299 stop:12497 length:2199 start_codon:yes stop_codon:yes gene_type:complete